MKFMSFPIDSELIYNDNTLENIFTGDWEQKELKRYIAIKNIIPVAEYAEIEFPRDRTNVIEFAASAIDKRIKFTGDINNKEVLYTMLLIYKNNSIYKGATAIEVKEIEKHFNTLSQKELFNMLQDLHTNNIISWENRGDLNQIRFRN